MKNLQLLKNIWQHIYDPNKEVVLVLEKYFHPEYEQCINGQVMSRSQYINHVIEQRKNMKIDDIKYKHALENADELFAIYYPRGKNINNESIEAEVIAYFRFNNHQLFRVHGQVRLIKGNLSDVDMKE